MPVQLQHEILTGSFFPDLESALCERVASFRDAHDPLFALPIVVPSNLLKVYLRRRLVELGQPHMALKFLTLQELVADILRRLGHSHQLLPPFADELIMERL